MIKASWVERGIGVIFMLIGYMIFALGIIYLTLNGFSPVMSLSLLGFIPFFVGKTIYERYS